MTKTKGDATTVAPEVTQAERPSAFRLGGRASTVDERAAQRYERGKEIARGGLGRVTSALDRTLQREVAIKELHERTEQGMRRFVREGLTTARLQHPAIMPILDAGAWEGGDPFLVMKLLAGKTLAEELATRTTTAGRMALLPNLLSIADALGYAHEQGVIHRDVKPSNIMIGTHGETVLLDWGIAHDGNARDLESEGRGRGPEPVVVPQSDEPLTVVGSLAGTVRYMSPEQARGEPPVPGFDVYSLGVTIATALGGHVHPDADSQEEVVAKLRAGKSPIPKLPDDVPADLGAIVAKATAPIGERYAHAGLLADDLRQFIAGKLVSARSYTRAQLLVRWVQRNRVLVGALAIVLVIAVIAVRSIIAERNVAVAEREQAEARERDLILLQARASLRTDPTATIAWLKDYPTAAPHQDDVLALVDEAEGRGVARHVWRGPSATAAVTLMPGALVAANRDGTLVRADLATGARRTLGTADKPLRYVVAAPHAVFALDQDGGLWRGTDTLERRQTVVGGARATGLYYLAATDELKVTFPEDEATFVPASTLAPPTLGVVPTGFEDNIYDDDENSARAWYFVEPDGKIFRHDGTARLLGAYSPSAWVRGSHGGLGYAVIAPVGAKSRGDRVTIALGEAAGGEPVTVGEMRACGPGDDRDELAEVSDDGRVAIIKRCGTMVVFSRGAEPREIDDAESVSTFDLARDGRWLALGRSGGLEVENLVTGATRDLVGGATVRFGELGDGWVATGGGAQGTRVWPTPVDDRTGKLGELAAPARLVVTRTGELSLLRHLQCARWSIAERRVTASFGITAAEARDVDEEQLLFPQDISPDGRTCVFAGETGAVVVADDGTKRTLASKRDLADCVIADDTVTCSTSEPALVTFDASGSAERRAIAGKPRGLARYRGKPVLLVARPTGCALEDAGGHELAALPGGADCRRLRASGGSLIVERSASVDVWNDAGVLTVPTEVMRVEVGNGLVAVPRDQALDIWDVATRAKRAGPPPHVHAIERVAWSPHGVLASADDEVVQLWDPATGIVRVIYAPHTVSLAWNGDKLYTTDGKVIVEWPIDIARGASSAEVRARLAALTSARIVNGVVETP